MERVYEHREVLSLRRRPERIEPRVPQHHAGNVAADLDTAQAKTTPQRAEMIGSDGWVLERHCAKSAKTTRRARDHLGNLVIGPIAQHCGIVAGQPIGQ